MRIRRDLPRQYCQPSSVAAGAYVNGIQAGQGYYITRIVNVCRKHLQPAHICHCPKGNSISIALRGGTRCPRKTAKNKWKKLLALVGATIK